MDGPPLQHGGYRGPGHAQRGRAPLPDAPPAEIAMDTADVICFFCDGRTGLTSEDEDVANYLRRTRKPLLLVVNKMDYQGMNDQLYEYYNLGLGDPIAISSTNMLGLGDLLEEIVKRLPPPTPMRPRRRDMSSSWRWWSAQRGQKLAVQPAAGAGAHHGQRHPRHHARRHRHHLYRRGRARATTSSTPPACARKRPWRMKRWNATACCARSRPSTAATWPCCSLMPRPA